MSTMKKGNLFWKDNLLPNSGTNPVHAKDVNSDSIKNELVTVKNELALVKTELATIKANQLSGDQKVQVSGNIVERVTLLNAVALTQGNQSLQVSLPDNITKCRRFEIYITDTHTNASGQPIALNVGIGIADFGVVSDQGTSYAWRLVPTGAVDAIVSYVPATITRRKLPLSVLLDNAKPFKGFSLSDDTFESIGSLSDTIYQTIMDGGTAPALWYRYDANTPASGALTITIVMEM